MITELDCLIVRYDPFAMIVGRPLIKKMRASLHSDKDVATFRHEGGATKVSLVVEGAEGYGNVSDEVT